MKLKWDREGCNVLGVIRSNREKDFVKKVKAGSVVDTKYGMGKVVRCTQEPSNFAGVWEVKVGVKVRFANPLGFGVVRTSKLYLSEEDMVLA
jgi:hypothetical protein